MIMCSFSGCGRSEYANGLCGGHNQQRNKGKALKPLRMPYRQRAVIALDDNTCALPLTKGRVAIVDAVDADLGSVPWTAMENGINCYAGHTVRDTVTGKRTLEQLHRVVAKRAGLKIDGLQVDHIDCDGLNCRRRNLRPATKTNNARNVRAPRTNTSGIKGVSWYKSSSKWVASICVDGKKKTLGYFQDIELAAFVYEEAAHKYHGEFARAA